VIRVDADGAAWTNAPGSGLLAAAGAQAGPKSAYDKCVEKVTEVWKANARGSYVIPDTGGRRSDALKLDAAIEGACAGLPGDPVAGRKNWKEGLPDCPCTAKEARNTGWKSEGKNEDYHPGSEECFRKKDPAGACMPGQKSPKGQQCCYDKAGNLITHGPGAGTPDKVSPDGASGFLFGATRRHLELDVDPLDRMRSTAKPGLPINWEAYQELGWEPNRPKACKQNWGAYNPKTGRIEK
jgi:hypothetical protein